MMMQNCLRGQIVENRATGIGWAEDAVLPICSIALVTSISSIRLVTSIIIGGVDQQKAEDYAKSWIEAWNAHDVEALGRHYSEDVVFRSPFIPKLIDNPTCVIRGREDLKIYLAKGMEAYPHSRLQLHRVGVGGDSNALNYIIVE